MTSPSIPAEHPAWADRLRAVGLRVTGGRVAVLEYLEAHPHSSAAEVLEVLEPQLPSISAQSVHNIVHDLTEHELIRRIDLPDSTAARYETRTRDNHHHVQCVVCGRIEDVDCAVGHAPCLTPSQTHGIRVLVAEVTYRGVCADCEAEIHDDDHSHHPSIAAPAAPTERSAHV
ncbi:Fur family transcriptional regulator [Pseudoclavibacter soli]|uniref:Fur family transcriptional regulator n=1 Tax=Pseudoclavibacter soli TaxID=452623 RepID=UPI0003FB50FC|nr:Fur family transcriptional regulator [Pseudoclavibacter soli]